MAHIVILGGGLAGISAAYHLEQQGFFDYQLFEKRSHIGGLCGSIEQDGFTFDYTGHLLHINDPYFHNLIANTVGFDHFNVIHRKAVVYSNNCYTNYPYQIYLHGLPIQVISDCIKGYITRHTHIKRPVNFKAWVLKHFGAGFAKHFFLPFQKKIFAYDLNKITSSWTGRFVPTTSLEEIIAGSCYNVEQKIGYNAQFFYPKQGGIFSWVEKLAQLLHNNIKTSHEVTHIDLKRKTVFFDNGHAEPYSILINTIPLDRFLSITDASANCHAPQYAYKLLCNSVLNFNLGFNKTDLSDKHWIYFPEQQYPFYRLGFPHNFSSQVVPPGCSSLYGEIAYMHKSSRWKENIINKAITVTKELLHVTDADIITKKIIDISHAYVIYDQWRDKHINHLLRALEEQHIYSIGRYGAWKYCSMQETVLDGKNVVQKLSITKEKPLEQNNVFYSAAISTPSSNQRHAKRKYNETSLS